MSTICKVINSFVRIKPRLHANIELVGEPSPDLSLRPEPVMPGSSISEGLPVVLSEEEINDRIKVILGVLDVYQC